MLTFRQMLRYLRSYHSIKIKPSQTQALRNMGYYHGYKGYRFIRNPKDRIPFKNFNEIIAINNFDMQLKTLLYPKVMFIETALKSYVLEAVLDDSKSESLNTIFNHSLTYYKNFTNGSSNYKDFFVKRMSLRGAINSTLKRNYNSKNQIVKHFFDNDKEIPIWAIFESMSLGVFGDFFSCCNVNVKTYTSKLLQFPSNLDADGELTLYVILTIKDLRNAIAHNNVIFDTRFHTKNINSRLVNLLNKETGIKNIDFQYIDAYIILIVYILRKMKVTKTECKQLVAGYNGAKDLLRKEIPTGTWNKILGTQTRANMNTLLKYITSS